MTDIAFAGGEVVMVGSKLKADSGTDVRGASDYLVTPGLVDLHTDIYWVATSTLPVAEASRNAELTCVTRTVSGIDFARTKTLTAANSA